MRDPLKCQELPNLQHYSNMLYVEEKVSTFVTLIDQLMDKNARANLKKSAWFDGFLTS